MSDTTTAIVGSRWSIASPSAPLVAVLLDRFHPAVETEGIRNEKPT
jgi:hypothetical protein